MRVVNLFEVIHINEDKTTVVFLHKLRHQLLTTTPHRQSGQKIISFTVLVCFHRSHDIGDKAVDIIFNCGKSQIIFRMQIIRIDI